MRFALYTIAVGALLGCSHFCGAQPYHNAVGVRWAEAPGFTFRQMQTEKHAIEALLTFRWGGLLATGLYESCHPIGKGNWHWYYGGGAHLGYHRRARAREPEKKPFINVGLDLIVGIEHAFPNTPLALSLDLKPSVTFTAPDENTREAFGLSLRYTW